MPDNTKPLINVQFKRALIIRKEWLELYFSGVMSWELRSSHTKIRGLIGLIEAGSGEVKGVANLADSIGPLSKNEFRSNVSRHKVPYKGVEHTAAKSWNHAWVLEDVVKFETPIPYKHPRGAVIWVLF